MLEVLVKTDKGGKSFWTKVGMAFPSQGGGYTVRLEALPLNGTLYLLPPREKRQGAPRRPEQPESTGYGPDDFGGDEYRKEDDLPF